MSEDKGIEGSDKGQGTSDPQAKDVVVQRTPIGEGNKISQLQPLPIATGTQPENMEVHKHPHHVTHKKRWGEYFLEFLMIFLAVFLGFVAENIREKSSNREIEKNNIKSFVKNLQEDSLQLIRSIDVNEKRYKYLDSLIYLKQSNAADDIFQRQFLYYMLKLGFLDYFASNKATFKQMQSSGTLRLVSHTNVLDSILSYETHNDHIEQQEQICATWWNKAIEQVSSVIDLTPIAQLPPEGLWNVKLKDLDNIPTAKFSKNLPTLQSYYNWRINERISLGYYVQDLHKQLADVRILIPFLQKEYHLKI